MRLKKLGSKEIALTAVFAAVYAIVTLPPWKIPIIGVPKGGVEPSAALGPVFGFILGPYLGFIAAFLGAMIGLVMPPGFTGDVGGFLMPFCPAISAFVAGSITNKSMISKRIKGWMVGALTLFVLILSWYAYCFGPWNFTYGPLTEEKTAFVISYPILHFTGLMIPLIFRDKLPKLFRTIQKGKFSIPVALACWSAILSDQMLGNLIWITVRFPVVWPDVYPIFPEYFLASIPAVLPERITFAVVAALITVVLVPILISAKLMPRMLEEN